MLVAFLGFISLPLIGWRKPSFDACLSFIRKEVPCNGAVVFIWVIVPRIVLDTCWLNEVMAHSHAWDAGFSWP